MGNKSSLMLQDEEINAIQNETGFSASQIERLYSRFTSLDKGDNGTLGREDFLRIPELAINPLGDRIVQAFFNKTDSYDERINFRQFMRVLARFRPLKKNREVKLNSREDKLRFAFKMYDLDGDEKISREELLAVLHMMVGSNISTEQLANIADRTIMEADKDGDQCITFSEFCKTLERTDVEGKMSIRFLH
ncbi:Calcineurin B homologous protein 1 [Sarcoptes scabiei]|uniref:Calcineurin B homologous protein 1 n=1 Tax=Sarcoptes scabiei TaxID=52283 RepID=A0A834QY87_SARSC|nr:Calcineurin B homologous protein 1 [Sarcoptes scabiei]UXI16879.1 spectrin beta chain non-erythrocytic 5 [Sarcoptes scabiei]